MTLKKYTSRTLLVLLLATSSSTYNAAAESEADRERREYAAAMALSLEPYAAHGDVDDEETQHAIELSMQQQAPRVAAPVDGYDDETRAAIALSLKKQAPEPAHAAAHAAAHDDVDDEETQHAIALSMGQAPKVAAPQARVAAPQARVAAPVDADGYDDETIDAIALSLKLQAPEPVHAAAGDDEMARILAASRAEHEAKELVRADEETQQAIALSMQQHRAALGGAEAAHVQYSEAELNVLSEKEFQRQKAELEQQIAILSVENVNALRPIERMPRRQEIMRLLRPLQERLAHFNSDFKKNSMIMEIKKHLRNDFGRRW